MKILQILHTVGRGRVGVSGGKIKFGGGIKNRGVYMIDTDAYICFILFLLLLFFFKVKTVSPKMLS